MLEYPLILIIHLQAGYCGIHTPRDAVPQFTLIISVVDCQRNAYLERIKLRTLVFFKHR